MRINCPRGTFKSVKDSRLPGHMFSKTDRNEILRGLMGSSLKQSVVRVSTSDGRRVPDTQTEAPDQTPQATVRGPDRSTDIPSKASWRTCILTPSQVAGPGLVHLLGRQGDLAAVIVWHKYLTACPSQQTFPIRRG